MINLIPEIHKQTLLSAIAKGDINAVKIVVEENNLDLNVYEERSYSPLIMQVLTSYGIKNENDRLIFLQYFLDNGADPNMNCKEGYNSLHVAVQQENLIKALNLFIDFGGDVNALDKNGASVAYWAIQGFPWRTEGEKRELHLQVLEKILMLGADLDCQNKFGVTPRSWLEHSPVDVKSLVQKCEQLHPVYKPASTRQPEFPTRYAYPEIVKNIRENMIPVTGQPESLEGEMLRNLDILKDEAHRNGNVNFSDSHRAFAEFILDNLTTFTRTDKKDVEDITAAVKKLMDPEKPYLEDDIYDYLTDQICIFHQKISNDDFVVETNKKWWQIWKQK